MGFLHWGYNAYGTMDPWTQSCYPASGGAFPPGNSFIVYPGKDGPVNSMRAQIQLFGAEEYELLRQLPKDKCEKLVDSVCSDFEDYETDPARLDEARRKLLLSF